MAFYGLVGYAGYPKNIIRTSAFYFCPYNIFEVTDDPWTAISIL